MVVVSGSLQRLGRALALPLVSLGRAYNQTAKQHPATTGIVTTVLKTSAADLFAQKVNIHTPYCSYWSELASLTVTCLLASGGRAKHGRGLEAECSLHILWAHLPGEAQGVCLRAHTPHHAQNRNTFLYATQGCWQFYLYNSVFVRMTPSIISAVGTRFTPAVLTFLDQAVQ